MTLVYPCKEDGRGRSSTKALVLASSQLNLALLGLTLSLDPLCGLRWELTLRGCWPTSLRMALRPCLSRRHGGCCHRGWMPQARADRNLPATIARLCNVGAQARGLRGQPTWLKGYHHGCRKENLHRVRCAREDASGVRRLAHNGRGHLQEVPLKNREGPLDEILGLTGPGAIAVVDQKRNIGALAIERARSAGVDVRLPPRPFHGAHPRPVSRHRQDR